MSSAIRCSFSCLLLVAFSQVGLANDWLQFRGSEANPVSESSNIPDKWSTTENVEWVTDVAGRGWSSPIVVGDRVFVTAVVTDGDSKKPQVGTDYSNAYVAELMKQGLTGEEVKKKVTERDFELPEEVNLHYFLYCLDLKSGSELWKQEFHTGKPPGGRHRKNSFASETPVSDGKNVYVYSTHVGLFAYDLDGQQLWKTELENHPVYMEFGTGASPALVNNKIIIVDDNEETSFIAAYDTANGEQLWKTERSFPEGAVLGLPKSAWMTPFIWETEKRTEIVTVGPGKAVSYDEDGNELWRMKGMGVNPCSSSFAVDGLLLLNGGKTKPIFAIRPGASGDLSPKRGKDQSEFIAWSIPRGGTYIPSAVASDGLYVLQDNGILQRYDLKDGTSSYKKRIKSSGADFTASPWVCGDKLFCLSEQGDAYVLKTGAEYELLHSNPLGEFCMATPALIEDRLILRTESKVYSIRKSQ